MKQTCDIANGIKFSGPLLLLVLTVMSFIPGISHGAKVTKHEVLQETKEALSTAQEYSKEKTTDVISKAKGELEALEVKLKDIQSNVSEKTKRKNKKAIDNLAKSLSAAETEIEQLKTATKKSWASLRKNLKRALDDVEKNYQDVIKE